ncbi:MAG: M12 family metallopeptidase [Bryobacterales bacterium]|nr:M12 family metallopeptidase [Bryobacterales bacterium]
MPPLLAAGLTSRTDGTPGRRETARIDPTVVCGVWDFNESVMCSLPDAPGDLVRLVDVLRWFERYLGVSSNAGLRFELWPDGVIPYAFDGDFSSDYRLKVERAMMAWTAETNIEFRRVRPADFLPGGMIDVPILPDVRTPTPYDAVFVRTKSSNELGGNSGRASAGKISVTVQLRTIYKNHRSHLGIFNGQQDSVGVDLSPEKCEFDCVVHEFGYTIGLLHEHQRWDREQFVRVQPRLIADRYRTAGNDRDAFLDTAINLGPTAMPLGGSPYDYTSVMHYDLRHTVPPGIRVSPQVLSSGDVIGVKRMYGFALPTATVIETNPRGLEIIVDGKIVETPYPVLGPTGTEHTLEAPLVQHNGSRSERHLFGNWGGSGRQSAVPIKIHITARQDKTLWFQANYIVQTRRSGDATADPYCQPWVYDESQPDCDEWPYGEWSYKHHPAPPSYAGTYEAAASYYRDRIAAWPQAFTFVSPVGDRDIGHQSFWLTNTTDSEQLYLLRNHGRDTLSILVKDPKGSRIITHDFWSQRLGARETAELEFRTRKPSQYVEGSYDAAVGVCQVDSAPHKHLTALAPCEIASMSRCDTSWYPRSFRLLRPDGVTTTATRMRTRPH